MGWACVLQGLFCIVGSACFRGRCGFDAKKERAITVRSLYRVYATKKDARMEPFRLVAFSYEADEIGWCLCVNEESSSKKMTAHLSLDARMDGVLPLLLPSWRG